MTALIICAGEEPSEQLLKIRAMQADMVIAADGGADVLYKYGIMPDVLIGDFDSANKNTVEYFKNKDIETVGLNVEKDETDTMIAIDTAVNKGCTKAIIIGALGKRFDHGYANVMLLKYAFLKGLKAVIEDDYNTVEYAQDSCVIEGETGTTVSILPFGGEAEINCSEGLYYPAENLSIKAHDVIGISNVLTKEKVCVDIKGSVLIIKIK